MKKNYWLDLKKENIRKQIENYTLKKFNLLLKQANSAFYDSFFQQRQATSEKMLTKQISTHRSKLQTITIYNNYIAKL